jgi:UDP-N-acetylglucosamine acyltransferase
MTVARIHPTALVAPEAELAADVEVGPYALIGARVRIGAGSVVGAHAVIEGNTEIGSHNRIYPFASVGLEPQDLKYDGEDSRLIIGDHNCIREFVTLNSGTEAGGMETRLGDDNLLMNYVHVAHDCRVGDHNVIANGVQLGGHVTIESFTVLGALSGLHQFVKVGESAIVGAGSMVSQDVPPFCNATGDRARLRGLNTLGLKRRGLSAEAMHALKRAYRIMFQSGLKMAEAAARIRQEQLGAPEVERFVEFVERSERGVCR